MYSRLDLGGTWELAGFDEGEGDWTRVESPYPVAASVPGEVHPALQEAGLIGDPFWGLNDDECQWVERKEWWYRRVVYVPDGFLRTRTFIEFDGLDTFATILLNGEEIGSSRNMFVPYRFDVTGKIREDAGNLIEVRFRPVLSAVEGMDLERLQARYNNDRLGARKFQASFGWDWMPRLLGAGIWQGARIVSHDRLSISDIHVKPGAYEKFGLVDIRIEVENHQPHPVDAVLSITIPTDEGAESIGLRETIPTSGAVIETDLEVENPRLWWPNGLGEQPLYDVLVELHIGGEMIDSCDQQFAFRTVELRERDKDGNPAFYFEINGLPVFARGANWIPANAFPSQVTTDHHRRLLELARDAGLNMLRVWGGGVYEKPDFYRLCDEFGIMVWQDFMFSLAEYPDGDDFANSVASEASQVVRRLRNHPSVVLWCGNNECEMDTEANSVWSGKRLFHEIIPRVVRELDSTRPYWPSSPYGGEIAHSSEYGDYHGEPWFKITDGDIGKRWEYVRDDRGRFMSETPTQGPPEVESLRRFIPEDELFPIEGPVWDKHCQNNDHRQEKTGFTSRDALLRNTSALVGEASTVEQFAYFGGIGQGEFLRWQIEYYRRNKAETRGCLIWDFNDAWTMVGYSLVDYYGRPKPAYYYVKRAFTPVALILADDDGQVSAYVVNDTPEQVQGEVIISRQRLDEESGTQEMHQLTVKAGSVTQVWSGDAPVDQAVECVAGVLQVDGDIVSRSSWFGVVPRDIRLPETELSLHSEWNGDGLRLRVSSTRYAYGVCLTGLPDHARPEDNYFDLLPGETRELLIVGVTPEEAERISVTHRAAVEKAPRRKRGARAA